MKSCIQKALYNLQKALCQSWAFTQCDQVSGQPHPQRSSGRKLLRSIINSPLIQLSFFLFHFRITISCSPRKSPNRLLMIRGRGNCHQDLPDGPKHSSNCGLGWISPVETSDLSSPWVFAISSGLSVFLEIFRDGVKLGSTQGQHWAALIMYSWGVVGTQ